MENINTLNNLFKDIADSIREKKGSTDKILPKNFSSEIRNISGGGSSSIKQYFYRYDKEKILELNEVDTNQKGSIYIILGMFGIIHSLGNSTYGVQEVLLNEHIYDSVLLPYCRLIDFNNAPSVSLGMDDNRRPEVFPLNGDIFERIEFIGSHLDPSIIPMLKSCFTEITEEEYISNINFTFPFNN